MFLISDNRLTMADFMQVPLSVSVKCPLVLLLVSMAISSVQTYNSDNNYMIYNKFIQTDNNQNRGEIKDIAAALYFVKISFNLESLDRFSVFIPV